MSQSCNCDSGFDCDCDSKVELTGTELVERSLWQTEESLRGVEDRLRPLRLWDRIWLIFGWRLYGFYL